MILCDSRPVFAQVHSEPLVDSLVLPAMMSYPLLDPIMDYIYTIDSNIVNFLVNYTCKLLQVIF